MKYSTVYVGMDVHKETFSLCCYTNEKEQAEYPQKVDGHYSKVINYIEAMRFHYGDDALFICGYEAGCLGFTLYHQLTDHNMKCVILAPTTMLQQKGKKKVKTDKRDAALIARCLAHHDYSPVHIPTEQDEQTREYIRMRDDHKLALKKVKQQIMESVKKIAEGQADGDIPPYDYYQGVFLKDPLVLKIDNYIIGHSYKHAGEEQRDRGKGKDR